MISSLSIYIRVSEMLGELIDYFNIDVGMLGTYHRKDFFFCAF